MPLEYLKNYNYGNTRKNLTRGGEFIVRETDCNDVFTPEDFTEEQKMMKDAVHDFAEKEIWSKKSEFENTTTI